ncbi:hypothetical protein WEN_00705 [Mycoplasma wenyonii str. Massachusetts]|uniref:Uncharacterized protein n=1 Tax=Mycoplasma wenyonii (strain Massachusetts) TaxID=1197325 RepID=I6YAH2_MYCWM|nr:DUF3713 domain-containing protein [Mycoplasma wenyonii]AFN64946.1 hypothetical protein WEN_00705 [Mycoplasma wenyonii str. Massachusetts]
MLWIKKLLFTTILGTSVIAPSVTLTRQQEALERLELDSTLKKWNRLLEKISGDSEMEKLSKIFAKNLTTFSRFALINAVKQLLMGWAIKIWENQEDFFPISQRLNKFFFYHHIYHWKTKNEVEELSWELIKKFFIDFFFNEKGWFLLSQFGDFSSFVLKEWEEKERPMKLYEWKISYSNAGEESSSPESKKSKLYDSAVLESLKTRVPYLFPEIEGNKEYSTLISRLTHKNEIELNLFKKKWVTISDLSKITDGYALGALLHMYAQQSTRPQTTSAPAPNTDQVTTLGLKKGSQQQNTPDPLKNPLYIFAGGSESSGAGQGSESGKCLTIDSSLFKEEIKKEFKGKDLCIYGVRWINQWENGGGGGGGSGSSAPNKPKILVSREMDGISFYYSAEDSKLKAENGQQKTLNQQEPEVIEKVKQYLTDNFETIFAKFLVSKKGKNGDQNYTPFTIKSINTTSSDKSQTFDFTEFFKKNSGVIDASVAYLEDLYWTEKIKVLQNILLSVYKHTPQNIQIKRQTSGQKNNISLKKESGLFAPLPFKRSNGEETTKKLELPLAESSGTTNSQKHEFFEDLLKLLPTKQQDSRAQKISLKSKAEELKKLITNKNGQKPFSEDSLRKLFLENSYFRAQLEAISGNKLKAIDTIFALKAEEILFPNKGASGETSKDFSKLLQEFAKTIKGTGGEGQTQDNNTWEDLINKGLFLEPFLNSPIEKKLLYGSFSSSEQVAPEGSSGTSTKEITNKSKNDWMLDNFYFSDSGYESSATSYKELLAFLLSIKWLTENNHSNFEKLINHIFSKNKNKNAYLVWTQEITSEEKKKLEGEGGQQEQQEQEAQPESKLKEFFKETISKELSNPLLSGENTMAGSVGEDGGGGKAQTKNFSSKNSLYETDAYKNGQTGDGQKTKLGGFLGLVTESFSTRDVPPALKNYIFGDFLKFNSTENKNYSIEGAGPQAEGGAKGIVEGAFFSDNHKRNLTKNSDLLDLLKEAKKKTSLLRYLDKETSNSLLIALSQSEKSEEVSELTLEELKEELSKALKSSDTAQVAEAPTSSQSTAIKDLYKLFNRFSGYIYSSKGDQKSPYVFTEKKEGEKEEKYYVGFVYQVNRFDFDSEGIKKLKENLSENTLNTLITLLASNREIRDWIYESEIIRQLSL